MLVECIEEEKIGVGIGDTVALIVSDGRSSLDEIRATHSEYHGGEYRVVDVSCTK